MSEEHSLEKIVLDLVDIYRPLEAADSMKLRAILADYIKFAPNAPAVKAIEQEVRAELQSRADAVANGPTFRSGDVVEVIADIPWWPKHMANLPPIGIQGVVSQPSVKQSDKMLNYGNVEEDYVGLVPVKFRSDDMGYGWEEGDDDDREFVRNNIPNWALKKV